MMARRDDDIEGEATALVVQTQPGGLFRTDDPVEVITKATRIADALKAVVVAKKLVTNIQGKEYPQVEAWLTLASMMNLRPVIEWSRPVDGGWEARCIVRNNNGDEVGAGEAQCTRDEKMWKSRDDYALRSMAQTRATSKSLRSVLGFIMTLAGYAPTPAEEVPADGDTKPRTPRVITTNMLMDIWKEKGGPQGSVQAWMRANVAGYTDGKPTDPQRKEAWEKLTALELSFDESVAARGAEEEPPPPPVTAASGEKFDLKSPQGKMLFALLGDLKIKTDDDRHIYASTVLGRTITSYTQLSRADATAIIDALNTEKGNA